ncbi:AraC family transcriptional regulator [Serratia liquefaciens]|uniref:AraC family transcriptional regulator n=1 Tax=Serratia liquefaciens TaxID=614 RepID=UPI0038142ED7
MFDEMAELQKKLVDLIGKSIKNEGIITSKINDLMFFRQNRLTAPGYCMTPPGVIIVVQGRKQIISGSEVYRYNNTNFLLSSLNIPVSSSVTCASNEKPCLALFLKMDIKIITELISLEKTPFINKINLDDCNNIALGNLTSKILDPFKRLIMLLDEPDAISTMAPMIIREIHYRLLMTEQSAMLRNIVNLERYGRRIANVINRIIENLSSPLRIDELASLANMSPPTLYQNFKKTTKMSPLQYQKLARLNEARHLMLNDKINVKTVSFKVGYESPSQFNREYKRLFGVSPKQDVDTLLSKI